MLSLNASPSKSWWLRMFAFVSTLISRDQYKSEFTWSGCMCVYALLFRLCRAYSIFFYLRSLAATWAVRTVHKSTQNTYFIWTCVRLRAMLLNAGALRTRLNSMPVIQMTMCVHFPCVRSQFKFHSPYKNVSLYTRHRIRHDSSAQTTCRRAHLEVTTKKNSRRYIDDTDTEK